MVDRSRLGLRWALPELAKLVRESIVRVTYLEGIIIKKRTR